MTKTISISAQAGEPISIDSLSPLQGELKTLSEENYQKLKKQILKNGFSAAIHVWRDHDKVHILDGHQRLKVLLRLREEGYAIPNVPIVEVHAKDMKQAKEQLLSHASTYGEFDVIGMDAFLLEAGFDIEQAIADFSLPLSMPTLNEMFDHSEKEFDESILEGCEMLTSFRITIPIQDSDKFEIALDDILKQFPAAKKEKKL